MPQHAHPHGFAAARFCPNFFPPCSSRPDFAAIHASTQVPGSLGDLVFQSTSGNRWGTVEFLVEFILFASPVRRECEPSVPCRSRCGSADGLALEPASQLCNRAHSRIALQVQPTRWARPPHAPASAASAAVLRSRGKIQFVIGTHADKTLGSFESGLTQPELVSNDDLTGGNVSHARTRCPTKNHVTKHSKRTRTDILVMSITQRGIPSNHATQLTS